MGAPDKPVTTKFHLPAPADEDREIAIESPPTDDEDIPPSNDESPKGPDEEPDVPPKDPSEKQTKQQEYWDSKALDVPPHYRRGKRPPKSGAQNTAPLLTG